MAATQHTPGHHVGRPVTLVDVTGLPAKCLDFSCCQGSALLTPELTNSEWGQKLSSQLALKGSVLSPERGEAL